MSGAATGRRCLRPVPCLAVLVVVIGLLLGGCGVPRRGPVETVAPGDVPYGLLAQERADDGSGPPGRSAGAVEVYFVLNERLVGVPIARSTGADPLRTVLAALAAGPTTTQQEDGLGTSIPPGLTLRGTETATGTASIDLQGDAAQPDIGQNPLTTGQIVLTVTALPGYRQVLLTRDGEPVQAVLPNGELSERPVTAANYQSLASRGT